MNSSEYFGRYNKQLGLVPYLPYPVGSVSYPPHPVGPVSFGTPLESHMASPFMNGSSIILPNPTMYGGTLVNNFKSIWNPAPINVFQHPPNPAKSTSSSSLSSLQSMTPPQSPDVFNSKINEPVLVPFGYIRLEEEKIEKIQQGSPVIFYTPCIGCFDSLECKGYVGTHNPTDQYSSVVEYAPYFYQEQKPNVCYDVGCSMIPGLTYQMMAASMNDAGENRGSAFRRRQKKHKGRRNGRARRRAKAKAAAQAKAAGSQNNQEQGISEDAKQENAAEDQDVGGITSKEAENDADKPRKLFCCFCRKNKEPRGVFRSHRLKIDNIITCPVLRKYICPVCNATGDEAHTLKYCPENTGVSRIESVHQPINTGRNARGILGKTYQYCANWKDC